MKANIITVVPLSRSLPKDHLSYFSTKKISFGDIVEIPIKKQFYKALVIKIEDAQKQKGELKNADFKLRAIKKVLGPSPFSFHLFTTIEMMQIYFLGSLSQIFSDALPKLFLENIEKLKPEEKRDLEKTSYTKERLVFQKPFNERIDFYKSLIRESFARRESIRFCVPTIQEASAIQVELEKGIKEYCVVFHSKKTPKTLLENWDITTQSSHPLCLIHTTQFLCVPRSDVGTLIIEHESSPHYRSNKTPFVDGRIFTEAFARVSNIKLILADNLLRTETLTRHKHQEFGVINNLYFRIDSEAHHKIVDMRLGEPSFKIISYTVLQEVLQYYHSGKKIVLFSLRPGLASTTVCHDCGTTLTHKGTPLTLHIDPETGDKYYKSKKHNEVFRANIVCVSCGSWNLVPLGVGTEKIEELIQENNKDISLFRIDQNHNNTPNKIIETIDEFYSKDQGAILITSLIGIPYLKEKVDLTCIISLDTLFNIPQFNMYEKIMHIIMDLSMKTKEKLYIQTRNADQKIISILNSKKLLDFFEYDYEERKYWDYPPFSNIIKMSYDGPREEQVALESYLKKTFKDYEMYMYHGKSSRESNKLTHAVLKVPAKLWPLPWNKSSDFSKTKELKKKLMLFPSSWTIIVNPHDLL